MKNTIHSEALHRLSRRELLKACGLGAAVLGAPRAFGQGATWPVKPIRLIATQAPGSSNDATARALAEYMTKELGVTVVVENRPGAISTIGGEVVAHSPADGHTLLITLQSSAAQASVLVKNPAVNFDTDLVPVASVGVGPVVGVAHKAFPANSLKELIALARTKPVNCGNYAIGSGWQLMLHQLSKDTGAEFNVATYKGTGAMLGDLYGGQVSIGAGSLAGIGGGIKVGNVKPLVVTTGPHSKALPDTPTWAEAGFVGPAYQDLAETNMLFAPKGTPREIIDRIARLVQRSVVESERVKNVMTTLAEDETPLVGDDLHKFIARSWPTYRKLTRESGIAQT